MIQITVPPGAGGRRLDGLIKDQYPHVPHGIIFKTIRKKDILVNGQRVSENVFVNPGDIITAYIPDRYTAPEGSGTVDLDILFEDEHLLIVNKPAGMSVHPDRKSSRTTLIELAARYVSKNKSETQTNGLPALCHRLDHHTGGLVIIAKTAPARDFILQQIKEHRIRKFYRCLVKGTPEPPDGQAVHYIHKNPHLSQVTVLDTQQRHSLTAITRYRTIRSGQRISLLEIEIVTGRTHQIRAHMAHLGHPVLGDDKYGDRQLNRLYRVKTQQLSAFRLSFQFETHGLFQYLNGKTWTLKPLPFEHLDLDQIPLAADARP